MNKDKYSLDKFIYFQKTRKVKSPTRNYSTDAGIDFFIPEFEESFISDLISKNPDFDPQTEIFEDHIIINPHRRILIPSGIRVKFTDESCLIAANKSGVCTKTGLIFGAQVIDSSYTGEIHISIINTSEYPVAIMPNQKIIQFLHLPIILSKLREIDSSVYDEISQDSSRKDKGFGSSDNIDTIQA